MAPRVTQVCRKPLEQAGIAKATERRAAREAPPHRETDRRPLSLGSCALCHPASGRGSGNLTSPVAKCILRSELGLWNSS